MSVLGTLRDCSCCGRKGAVAGERGELSHFEMWKINLILGPETNVACWVIGNVFFFPLGVSSVASLSVSVYSVIW